MIPEFIVSVSPETTINDVPTYPSVERSTLAVGVPNMPIVLVFVKTPELENIADGKTCLRTPEFVIVAPTLLVRVLELRKVLRLSRTPSLVMVPELEMKCKLRVISKLVRVPELIKSALFWRSPELTIIPELVILLPG